MKIKFGIGEKCLVEDEGKEGYLIEETVKEITVDEDGLIQYKLSDSITYPQSYLFKNKKEYIKSKLYFEKLFLAEAKELAKMHKKNIEDLKKDLNHD